MKRQAARGRGILLAFVAAFLFLQPACGGFARVPMAAVGLVQAHPGVADHGGAPGPHVPGDATCCPNAGTSALAVPPSAPDAKAHSAPSVLAVFGPALRRTHASARTDSAWAAAPAPLPFHSRSSRILR